MKSRTHLTDWGLIAALTAFGIAMGHLEGVVVVYIREIIAIVPTPEQLGPEVLAEVPGWLIATEQTREAATIVMLVTLALVAGRSPRQSLGVFLYTFGVWDIIYYVALRVMIDWPSSLATTDCLFLIPSPWYAPVWVPMAVSCVLIIVGAKLMQVPLRQVEK
ncbi:MAG: hypothetical protein ACLFWB_07780 [Armatimonadota bacterium]